MAVRVATRPHRADKSPAGEVGGHGRGPAVVDVVAAAEVDVAPVLLVRTPAVRGCLQDRKHLDVDRAPAERLRDTLGPVLSDRRDDLHWDGQAGREGKV